MASSLRPLRPLLAPGAARLFPALRAMYATGGGSGVTADRQPDSYPENPYDDQVSDVPTELVDAEEARYDAELAAGRGSAVTPERATLQSIIAVMEKYDDPDDKLTIALGNFNRVEAEVHQLERQLAEKDEALREDPEKWSFWTLVRIARRILHADYPADVFDGSSGDPGPVFVTRLREALDALPREALRAEPAKEKA